MTEDTIFNLRFTTSSLIGCASLSADPAQGIKILRQVRAGNKNVAHASRLFFFATVAIFIV